MEIKQECNGSCFEQILKAAPNKIAAVRPLSSHLTNHLSTMRKTCQLLLKKQERIHKRRPPVDSYTQIHQWPTSKNLHPSVQCGHRVSSRGLATNNGREREKRSCSINRTWRDIYKIRTLVRNLKKRNPFRRKANSKWKFNNILI